MRELIAITYTQDGVTRAGLVAIDICDRCGCQRVLCPHVHDGGTRCMACCKALATERAA